MITVNDVNSRYRDLLRDKVASICPECQITEAIDRYEVKKYRVTLQDGWWFEITLDPGVVELIAKPAAIEYYLENHDRLQRLLFELPQSIGLQPIPQAGHVNFGLEATFGNDVLLFRNFIVDMLNHQELQRRILFDNDIRNAPTPHDLSMAQQEAFIKLVESYDYEKGTIQDFAERLLKEVYYETTWNAAAAGEPPDKFHALNIKSIALMLAWPRLEIRSIRGQRSLLEFILVTSLFRGRIEHLRSFKSPLEYKPNRSRSARDQLQAYYEYSSAAKLDWRLAQALVPKQISEHLDKFNDANGLPASDCTGLRVKLGTP